jgi:hypothetical protein
LTAVNETSLHTASQCHGARVLVSRYDFPFQYILMPL